MMRWMTLRALSTRPQPKDGAFILEREIKPDTAVFFVRVDHRNLGHALLLVRLGGIVLKTSSCTFCTLV